MNIIKALDRIGWRFGLNNKKPFPVNQNDIDAFNAIAEYVDRTHKQQFTDNELFAKLYIMAYAKMVEHFKTDILNHEPRKQMMKLLDRPMEMIIQDFTDRLNDSEMYFMVEEVIGGVLKHPITLSEEQIGTNIEKIKEAFRNDENVKVIVDDVWKYEDVKECLVAEVNHVLNNKR
jgi:hypothetical protein